MEFVESEAALKISSYLVISDLHIGFEEELEEKGYVIPDQTENVISRLKDLSKSAKKLAILGDVKHNIILRNKSRVLTFLSKLSQLFQEIIIIKGNHDARLEELTKNFSNIKVVDELMIKSTLLVHGHKYASSKNMAKAKSILIGHFHSAHKYKNFLGVVQTQKTWILYNFDNDSFCRKEKIKTGVKKVVSFPCFNAFFDGSGEKNGPYSKYLQVKDVLTLDLTRLV